MKERVKFKGNNIMFLWTKRINRWSDDERVYGPLSICKNDGYYQPYTIMYGVDNIFNNWIRLSAFGYTLIIRLPHLLSEKEIGYDMCGREYGFTYAERALHIHYGVQTYSSNSCKSFCWFPPWLVDTPAVTKYYCGDSLLLTLPRFPHRTPADYDMIDALRKRKVTIKDFDGEEIVATFNTEENEYTRGSGSFSWLKYFMKNKIYRSINIRFNKETGARKGSWKGGTIGCYYPLKPGESDIDGFIRYCIEHNMVIVGEIVNVD